VAEHARPAAREAGLLLSPGFREGGIVSERPTESNRCGSRSCRRVVAAASMTVVSVLRRGHQLRVFATLVNYTSPHHVRAIDGMATGLASATARRHLNRPVATPAIARNDDAVQPGAPRSARSARGTAEAVAAPSRLSAPSAPAGRHGAGTSACSRRAEVRAAASDRRLRAR
jgi:hypothetical protein